MNSLNVRTAKDVADFISEAMKNGTIVKGSGNSLRTTWAKVLKTVYDDNWEKVELSSIEPEKLNSEFAKRMTDKYKPDTIRICGSRINRIFRELEANNNPGPNEYEFSPEFEKVLNGMQVLQDAFLTKLEDEAFRRDGKEKYDYIALPISADKIAGLALPKNLTKNDFEKIPELIDGLLAYKTLKRKENCDAKKS